MPAGLRSARGALERHEPRRDALGARAGRNGGPDRPETGAELHQDRGRGLVSRPARALGRDDEESICRRSRGRKLRRPTMLSYDAGQNFLFQEARSLAEKRWEDWLSFYADDVVFFMPSWDDDDRLTTDPTNEASLIYYPNKQRLEDPAFPI